MPIIPSTYTVESVTAGHPDKLCDLIADTLLDEYLTGDPTSRVAIEVLGGHRMIHLAGEVTSRARVDHIATVRRVLAAYGYDTERFAVHVDLVEQSPQISAGVDRGGAGDQGVMYGFATNETPEYLPCGVVLAHALTAKLHKLRADCTLPWLGPDGKSQVTIHDGVPSAIVVSAQHDESIALADVRTALKQHVVAPVLHSVTSSLSHLRLFINPAGPFTVGGFDSDTGLTGRKTQVDTYGGIVPHGGGGFSGKDPTKVDRSGAYMARFAAKNLVAAGHARECMISVAYAIGEEQPLMLEAVDQHGASLTPLLIKQFDFRPRAIIERLGLRQPIFARATNAGHFGRPDLPWERLIEE